MLDLGNDFFLAKFLEEEHVHKVMLEGPSTILGSYIMLQPWSMDFKVAKDNCNSLDPPP